MFVEEYGIHIRIYLSPNHVEIGCLGLDDWTAENIFEIISPYSMLQLYYSPWKHGKPYPWAIHEVSNISTEWSKARK